MRRLGVKPVLRRGELSRPKTDGPDRRRREAEDVSNTRKCISILCNKVDYDNVGPWDRWLNALRPKLLL
jgi:hypothetical protein